MTMNDDCSKLVVSLTSYPHRFNHPDFLKVLKSLTTQNTNVRYKVVLNLFKDDIPSLNENVSKFISDNGIEVLECDLDLMQHKKYFYVMKRHLDIPVITVDDDMIYADYMVEEFWTAHLFNPDAVVGGRCSMFTRDENGKINCRRDDWVFKPRADQMEDLIPMGFGGILYPPTVGKVIDDKWIDVIGISPSDDILMATLWKILGIKCVNTTRQTTLDSTPYSNDNLAMYKRNKRRNYSDKCILYMEKFSSVDELKEFARKSRKEESK